MHSTALGELTLSRPWDPLSQHKLAPDTQLRRYAAEEREGRTHLASRCLADGQSHMSSSGTHSAWCTLHLRAPEAEHSGEPGTLSNSNALAKTG